MGWTPLDNPVETGSSDQIEPSVEWKPVDQPASKQPAPTRPLWDTGDVVRGAGSGLLRGTAGLIDTALTGGRPRVSDGDIPQWDKSKSSEENIRNQMTAFSANAKVPSPAGDFAAENAPSAMNYEPTSTAGGYSQTITEFAPGMMFPAGKGGMLTRAISNVVAPAITSETAGLAANKFFPDNESAEAWARLAGGFLGGPIASGLDATHRSIKAPSNVDPHIAALNRRGVYTTAGNVMRDPQMLAREAQAPNTSKILGNQPQQFTDAATALAGVKKPTDSQTLMEVIEAARKDAGQTYQRVTNGLNVMPSRLHVSRMRKIASDYATDVEGGLQTGTISAIQRGVENAFKSGSPISPKVMQKWRSTVSAATRSASSVARQSAIETLKVLDDVIGRSLAQAGRKDDIARLGEARSQYRDILAVEGGLLKSGKLGDEGIITPKALVSSLSNQGKEAFMRGRRGELADLARAGRARLIPMEKIPPVKPTAVGTALRIAGDTLGSLAGYEIGQRLFPGNALAQMLTSGAGTTAAEVLRGGAKKGYNAILSSPAIQSAMKRAAQNPPSVASGASPITGGLVGAAVSEPMNRTERKSGGRVSSHEADADQLVRSAERAKKGWSAQTEPLLNHSDESVVHALEVANRSI